jgi:phosphatidylserine decarboxylase
MRIRTLGGAEVIVVVQIAGLLARRMVCDVPVDDKLSIGGTYGLIWFGPGWTTTTPAGTDPLVGIGQRAVTGETTLAELS